MKKREALQNTVLNQYLRKKKFYCYYELKQTATESFSFAKIEKGQDEGLPALENSGLTWKFSDEDSRGKPCDGACLPPLPTYLVIKFKKDFYFIRYSEIERLKYEGVISISRKTAEELSEKIVKL